MMSPLARNVFDMIQPHYGKTLSSECQFLEAIWNITLEKEEDIHVQKK